MTENMMFILTYPDISQTYFFKERYIMPGAERKMCG